uniref:Acetyl-coenzyme A carboxylase carboxyl transferase subunit beta, chloroplastic n=1 Tax=Terniopsis yongtaiensis TaxID=2925018 RepID=A0AA51UBG5_9ROSI|nr:acetyl-CoA carboxylase carboxyltransferase beta subunit [Terniopsis yongtaiensis]WMV01159.1 acetyl-CoA carboxylase carboxyltransferase beta subunit [Terniopsis yongtaiensis]WMV01236.1 acetyl-CoA carboxylase carboxyltransferase beta subunit [Terniopsis yongtaiensis]
MIPISIIPILKISSTKRLSKYDTFHKSKINWWGSTNYQLFRLQTDRGLVFFSFQLYIANPMLTLLTVNDTNNLCFNYFDNYYFSKILYIEIKNLHKLSSYFLNVSENDSESLKRIKQYQYLWVSCDFCDGLNYRKTFMSKMYICEHCDSYVRMGSSERIDFLIDSGTWYPIDEDMVSFDPIQFDQLAQFDPIELDQIEQVDQTNQFFVDSNKNYPTHRINTESYTEIGPEVLIFSFIDIPLSRFLEVSFSRCPLGVLNTMHFPYIRYIDSYLTNRDLDIEELSLPKDENENQKEDHDTTNKVVPCSIDIDLTSTGEIAIEINMLMRDLNQIIQRGIPDEDQLEIDDKNEQNNFKIENEDPPYIEKLDSNQREHGLTEAVQTGIGQLNGIPIAIGVMDFRFIGGSMGSVVGEKITRLIEYATSELLPLILVCASGGARMQEGSLSLMQMAKISAALHDYQSKKKLFFISILTSPTTGGVIASFAMLADIIIAEPEAHIAFAGKRVIEQTLNQQVPEGSQEAEIIFESGLLDLIVPRNILKGVLGELFHLHNFVPVNPKASKFLT